MPTFTEGRHAAEFLYSEANGTRSRDQISFPASLAAAVVPGEVLGKRTVDPTAANVTVTAWAGNTGTGTFTKDATTPVLAGAIPGTYKVVCIEPGTDAGKFVVEDPNGAIIGRHTVGGAAFANQIKFTIADATDFIAGDGFDFVVPAGDGKFVPLDLTSTRGAGVAAGINLNNAPILAAVQNGAAVTRDAEVNGAELTWPSGITDDQKNAAIAQLAARGIIVR